MNAYKQSLYCGSVRILANLIMVAAVFLAMYRASRVTVWPSEAVFCLWFFGVTIPVWIVAWSLCKKIRASFPAEDTTSIRLPGTGAARVRWSLREQDSPSPLIRA